MEESDSEDGEDDRKSSESRQISLDIDNSSSDEDEEEDDDEEVSDDPSSLQRGGQEEATDDSEEESADEVSHFGGWFHFSANTSLGRFF
jgi:hypothetical protein